MSFYPLSLIRKLESTRYDRTIIDPFEDGSSSARTTWPLRYFKRQFKLTHAPLTLQEWSALRSFYAARNGTYGSFWFRDNVHREGHALVRFANPLQASYEGSVHNITIDLVETAAVRALIELDEITAAAGVAPLLWFDPNRELFYQHISTIYQGEASIYDPNSAYTTSWQAAASLSLSGVDLQLQGYGFTGTQWAKTTANISQLAAATPACTIFILAKHSAAAANQVIFSLGTQGAASCLGLALTQNNTYTSYIGTNSDFVYGFAANNPASTWRSFAAAYTAGSTTGRFFADGVASDINETRSYVAGPAALGAASTGALIANPANAMTNASVAHVLLFNATLTNDQVKALHNLLGVTYGLTAVA